MNSLVAAVKNTDTVPRSFEEKLQYLTSFGKVYLMNTGRGWHTWIEMHVTSACTTFKIDSPTVEGNTASQCTDVLIKNLIQTLKDLGVTK